MIAKIGENIIAMEILKVFDHKVILILSFYVHNSYRKNIG